MVCILYKRYKGLLFFYSRCGATGRHFDAVATIFAALRNMASREIFFLQEFIIEIYWQLENQTQKREEGFLITMVRSVSSLHFQGTSIGANQIRSDPRLQRPRYIERKKYSYAADFCFELLIPVLFIADLS